MSVAPFFLVQNDQKQTDPGSLEDLSRDEPDRALPLSEPMGIHRRSPLIRNRKTGSMEVKSLTHTHNLLLSIKPAVGVVVVMVAAVKDESRIASVF
jgi:hypothetical protein